MAFATERGFDPEERYRVGRQVVIRRESFGALAYDLRTRRLLVLKDLDLIAVLEGLDGSTSAADTVAAVAPAKRDVLLPALARLEREGMLGVV